MPGWTREELILALDLYFKLDIEWLRKVTGNSSQMVELSMILRNLSIHSADFKQSDSFRSPSSVHMKLMNFLRCDPRYGKAGLSNGNKLERVVWDEFKDSNEKLRLEAEAILKKFLPQNLNSDSKEAMNNDKGSILKGEIILSDLLIKVDQVIDDIGKLYLYYMDNRKSAAYIESLEESQRIVNEMYRKILKVNEWKINLAEIKKSIEAERSDLKSLAMANPKFKEDQFENLIKLPSKYSGVTLPKDLLLFIFQTIKDIDEKDICIESDVILKRVSGRIQKESSYKNPNYCLNNIIRFLTDIGVLILYQDAKRGKYVIEDYEIMQKIINDPEIIRELSE